MGKPSQQNFIFGAVLLVVSLSTYEFSVMFRVIWIRFLLPPLRTVVHLKSTQAHVFRFALSSFMIPPAPILVDLLLF